MADDSEKNVVRGNISVPEDGCLHCAFTNFAEVCIEQANYDPVLVIRSMAEALADIIGGLDPDEVRAKTTAEVVAALPRMVEAFAEGRIEDAIDAASHHEPGNA